MQSMIPLSDFLFYLGIEVLITWLWLKILLFGSQTKSSTKKKYTETVLRNANYPFEDGEIVYYDQFKGE